MTVFVPDNLTIADDASFCDLLSTKLRMGKTECWKMPSPSPSSQPPQALGSLKRPPLLSQGSSSSSLSGMEQAIPSFQSFINRTPPPDNCKPLPPTPLIPRRASSTSPLRSRTPSQYSRRRSSSVYSRTVSQWFDDDSSWRSVDLRDDPLPEMPTLPILQPVAYSKSTQQLVERPATPPSPRLEPRTYRPLIISPSPTVSSATTPNRSAAPSPGLSPLRQPLTPVMYPTSPPLHDTPQKNTQTISLEQAKAAVNSPGAVHLLPEELRAQSLGNSRSHEPIRVPTMKFFEHATPPELPAPPTLVEMQGQDGPLQSARGNIDARSEFPFPVIHGLPVPLRRPAQFETRAPLKTQVRSASKAKAAESLGLEDYEEPRGRTRQRGPRSTEYSHYVPKPKCPERRRSSDDDKNDAQNIAAEHCNLRSEQYLPPSTSPAYNSDDSIRAHMKMVPQPLFKNKPAAKLPGSISTPDRARGSNESESTFHLRAVSTSSRASGRSRGSLPMKLFMSPKQMHHRTSTTGSIPISPLMNVASAPPALMKGSTGCEQSSKKSRSQHRRKDDRVSMYYPYVGSRKGKEAKEKKAAEKDRPLPPMPMLSADIIAQRFETPDGSAESSPLGSTPLVSVQTSSISLKARKESNANSDRQRTLLLQRLAGSAVKYADHLTGPSGQPEAHTHQSTPSNSTIASPHSPHLIPIPVKANAPPVHLGWSDSAKTKFDRAHSSVQYTKYTAPPPEPQPSAPIRRPTDNIRRGSDSRIRKASILGGLLDGWKERKREEKREELKKIIRVVPQGPPATMQMRDIVRPTAQAGIVRQMSLGTAVGQGSAGESGNGSGRPVSRGLGRRMSAFGWM